MAPLPKRPRLHRFSYRGPFAYFITIATKDRVRYFENEEIVSPVGSILNECCREFDFRLCGYCFMPDHLHFLAQGSGPNSDLKKFVGRFKQKAGYQFKRGFQKPLWQPSYYDHVLRKDEDVEGVVRYILFNPVRAGLVEDFRKYRYSGSGYFKPQP